MSVALTACHASNSDACQAGCKPCLDDARVMPRDKLDFARVSDALPKDRRSTLRCAFGRWEDGPRENFVVYFEPPANLTSNMSVRVLNGNSNVYFNPATGRLAVAPGQ